MLHEQLALVRADGPPPAGRSWREREAAIRTALEPIRNEDEIHSKKYRRREGDTVDLGQ